jgi:hypothetical protein
MTSPIWQTPKDLGIIADGTPFEKQLKVDDGLSSGISYQVIAGTLPIGVTLSDSGKLYGTPIVTLSTQTEINYKTNFTVRATNYDGRIADRTFDLMVSGILPATIKSTSNFLGTFYDGDYCKLELKAQDDALASQLHWSIVRGRLPLGITFNSNGMLEGFFYQNRVPDLAFSKLGWDKNAWDEFIYDFVKQEHDSFYEFTVELSDGVTQSRQTYLMKVVAKDYLTVDNSQIIGDTRQISIDRTPRHLPFISTMPQVLSSIKPHLSRENTYFSFKFDSLGFDRGVPDWDYSIVYEITSLDNKGWDQFGDEENHEYGVGFDTDEFDGSDHPLPPNLGLNEETGWYVGKIVDQEEYYKSYEFYVFARPDFVTDIANYTGHKSKFGLNILGPANESITWETDTFLGSIVNGKAIEMQIKATHSTNKPLEFILSSNGSKTPQGIVILKNGVLSGRASIEYTKLDNDTTMLDGGNTTADRTYTFTIKAQTANKSAYSEKEFTLVVDYYNKKPFDNLYLKAFPSAEQRRLFEGIINNQDIVPNDLIYRIDDPDFGKAKDLRFLFLPGVNSATAQRYFEVTQQNHYTKNLLLGDIKTAIALDNNGNVQYEVVYLDIIDESSERDPATNLVKRANRVIDLAKLNKNFYIEKGVEYTLLAPNSLDNMRHRIESSIGYANKNSLPLWMTSPQLDPNSKGQFIAPLGFISAAVLAYTKPNASNLIAYRLRQLNFKFNQIEFKFDRYQLDNYLSRNYDFKLNKFIPGVATTIDNDISVAEKFRYVGTVDYAVYCDYLTIEGKSIEEFKINADIPADAIVQTGDTVIFFTKGTFPKSIPGYVEHILTAGVNNHQTAVFNITVTYNIVTLSIKRRSKPGDIINVTKSKSFQNKQLFVESYPRQSLVPHWWYFTGTLIDDIFGRTTEKLIKPHLETTFDSGATQFINNRTYYSTLDPVAKYIKFPKTGVFT